MRKNGKGKGEDQSVGVALRPQLDPVVDTGEALDEAEEGGAGAADEEGGAGGADEEGGAAVDQGQMLE